MANRLEIENKFDTMIDKWAVTNDYLRKMSFAIGGETSKPTTAEEIRIACRNNNIQGLLEIGEAVQFPVDGVKRNFLVMDIITEGQHSSGLKLRDGLQTGVIFQSELCLDSLQFDQKEAFYSPESEMAAGTYYFLLKQHSWVSADVGKNFQFTTTKAVPAGGKLVFQQGYNVTLEGAKITIYESDGTTTVETVTMTEGSEGTSLGELSNAKNGRFNSCQRALLGNNNWKESALRQLLGSESATTGFWQPQNIWDIPPSWNSSKKGFMSLLSDDLRNNMASVERHTYRNTVCDGGGYDTTYDKIWLPSKKEMYMLSESNDDDTEPFAFYKEGSQYSATSNNADPIRIKTNTSGSAIYYWVASPHVGYAYVVRRVHPTGANDDIGAYSTHGVAPAFVIA